MKSRWAVRLMMDFENGMVKTSRWRSLTRNCDFQMNYRSGAKKVGRLVVVYFVVPDEEQAHPLAARPDLAWAVVASKKVGNAVARNRAKRLMREARRTGVLQNIDTLNFLAAQFGALDIQGNIQGNIQGHLQSNEDQRDDIAAEPKSQLIERAPGEENPVGHKIFAGLWIVLVARRNILSATSREVREELDTLLQSP